MRINGQKISVGIDIEEVKRFRTISRNRNFLDRVLLQEERPYYRSKGETPLTLAGIFAAKEAVVKALSQLSYERFTINDFAILHRENGVPFVRCARGGKVTRMRRGITISLSISHTSTLALAIAFAQKL